VLCDRGQKNFAFFSKSSRKIKSAQINVLYYTVFSQNARMLRFLLLLLLLLLLLPRVKDGTVDGVEIGEEGIVIVVVVAERRFVFAEEKAQKRLTE